MKRTVEQLRSEARRWEGYARAKGFRSVTQGFERPGERITILNGEWVVQTTTLASVKTVSRHDMLIGALKSVH